MKGLIIDPTTKESSLKINLLPLPKKKETEQPQKDKKLNLKYLSLVCLVIQNAVSILSIKYATTATKQKNFYTSTAVLMSEITKLISCLLMVVYECKGDFKTWLNYLDSNIFQKHMDTLKVMIPAVIYAIQNNLIYIAISNLPAATYQVTYQLRILTTAVFSVIMLGKSLTKLQWFAMVLLFSGVAIVQVEVQSNNNTKSSQNTGEQNVVIGFVSVIISCISSGFASVYFEKMLKRSNLWLRNIQLSMFGTLASIIVILIKDGHNIQENGFFYGYSSVVWGVIFMQAFGGLLVAVVMKYADNILKGFATSLSIIISTILSVALFDFHVTLIFLIGTTLVISAVFCYSLQKKVESAALETEN